MNPSASHVCNYAVLRYLPNRETGEFVNAGIVAHCPEMNWCGYAGDENDVHRVTQFFPFVRAEDYLKQRIAMFKELERVRVLIIATPEERLARSIFQELVKPRESVFRFGEMRSAMTGDPAVLVERLCEQYVKPKQSATTLTSV
jgi:hypothetical protein